MTTDSSKFLTVKRSDRLFATLHVATVAAVLLGAMFIAAGATTTGTAPGDFPDSVNFELGYSHFAPGDNITVTTMHGTSAAITTNETYCVEGTYTLASHDSADLTFSATVPNSGFEPTDPRQTIHITNGSGTFRLIRDMPQAGYLHVSFYHGDSFGETYFGQGDLVLRRGWGSASAPLTVPDPDGNPNAAIFQYLGEPVQPPANLETAYTKQGLTDAVERAAQKAGVTVKAIQIDDSEFPFVVGIVCEEGDWSKLEEQLKELDGYQYTGGLSGGTRHVVNIIPPKKYPSGLEQQINRRLSVRELMLYDRISESEDRGTYQQNRTAEARDLARLYEELTCNNGGKL